MQLLKICRNHVCLTSVILICDACDTGWAWHPVFIQSRWHWCDPINDEGIVELWPKFPVWSVLLSTFTAVCVLFWLHVAHWRYTSKHGSESTDHPDIRTGFKCKRFISVLRVWYSYLNQMWLFLLPALLRLKFKTLWLIIRKRLNQGQKSLSYQIIVQLIRFKVCFNNCCLHLYNFL